MPNDKIEITQEEFDDIYQIKKEITGDTPLKDTANPTQEDTTPNTKPEESETIISEQEQEFDDALMEELE